MVKMLAGLALAVLVVVLHDAVSNAEERSLSGMATINQELFVPAGETLRIMPGSSLRFGNGVGISVEGALEVIGEQGNPVTFGPSEGSARWAGISVVTGGSLKLVNAALKDAVEAVTALGGKVRVEGMSVSDCERGFAFGNEADVEIEGLKVSRIKNVAVVVKNGASVALRDCSITGPGIAGFSLARRCTVSVSGSSFEGLEKGVMVIFPNASLVSEGCSFTGNTYGVYDASVGSMPRLSRCRFSRNTYGIYAERFSAPSVEGCEITGNEYGIYATMGSSPVAELCRISGNKYGVYVDRTSYPRVNGCSLTDNMDYAVYLHYQSIDWLKSGNNDKTRKIKDFAKTLGKDDVEQVPALKTSRALNPKGGHVDFQGNYWGRSTTAEMGRMNGMGDIGAIYDFFDNGTVVFEGKTFVRDKVDYSGYLTADPLAETNTK